MALAAERVRRRGKSVSDQERSLEIQGESERFARLADLDRADISDLVRQYARCLVRANQRTDGSYWRGAARACRSALALAHEGTWQLISLPKALRESYAPPTGALPPSKDGFRQVLRRSA